MIGDIVAGWTLRNRLDIGLSIGMDKGPVAWTKATACAPQLSRQGRETGNSATGLPAGLVLEHRTAAQDNHSRCLGGVAPRQRADAFSGNTRDRFGPFRCKGSEVLCEGLKSHGVRL